MQLVTTAAATSLNGHQIQRPLHKIRFHLAGVKAANAEAITKFLADAKSVYVMLKRISGTEQTIWNRISLYELVMAASALEGLIHVTGTDASEAYTATFAMELNRDGALQFGNGDYAELNIENAVAGLVIGVSTIGHRRKAYSHIAIERLQVAAGEYKNVQIPMNYNGRLIYGMAVLVPNNAVDLKFTGRDNSFTADATDVKGQAEEKSQLILNHTTGASVIPDYAAFTADSAAQINDELLSVEITGNGDASSSVLILREV